MHPPPPGPRRQRDQPDHPAPPNRAPAANQPPAEHPPHRLRLHRAAKASDVPPRPSFHHGHNQNRKPQPKPQPKPAASTGGRRVPKPPTKNQLPLVCEFRSPVHEGSTEWTAIDGMLDSSVHPVLHVDLRPSAPEPVRNPPSGAPLTGQPGAGAPTPTRWTSDPRGQGRRQVGEAAPRTPEREPRKPHWEALASASEPRRTRPEGRPPQQKPGHGATNRIGSNTQERTAQLVSGAFWRAAPVKASGPCCRGCRGWGALWP